MNVDDLQILLHATHVFGKDGMWKRVRKVSNKDAVEFETGFLGNHLLVAEMPLRPCETKLCHHAL